MDDEERTYNSFVKEEIKKVLTEKGELKDYGAFLKKKVELMATAEKGKAASNLKKKLFDDTIAAQKKKNFKEFQAQNEDINGQETNPISKGSELIENLSALALPPPISHLLEINKILWERLNDASIQFKNMKEIIDKLETTLKKFETNSNIEAVITIPGYPNTSGGAFSDVKISLHDGDTLNTDVDDIIEDLVKVMPDSKKNVQKCNCAECATKSLPSRSCTEGLRKI